MILSFSLTIVQRGLMRMTADNGADFLGGWIESKPFQIVNDIENCSINGDSFVLSIGRPFYFGYLLDSHSS